MKSTAVVICNYNKIDFVLDCIKSAFESNFTDFDLIVVDNASSDGSVQAIRESFGDKLTLLVNEVNTGGSGGFNRGMQYAMSKGQYKYIHLLDNDVVIDANAIGSLVEFMEQHPEAGVCGSTLFSMEDRDVLIEMGSDLNLDEFGLVQYYHGERNALLPYSLECGYVAACSAIFRCAALEKSGLMDSEFFIYCDDIELCWRIRANGYKIYATSSSKIWHSTLLPKVLSTRPAYYMFRNKIYTFAKWLNDADFERLPNAVTERLARIMFMRSANPEELRTYKYALEDVMSNLRGKVDEYKINPMENERKIGSVISSKNNIAIHYFPGVNMNNLVTTLRKYTSAKITVITHGIDVSRFDGVEYVRETTDYSGFDYIINLCKHVLDIDNYNYGEAYIDWWFNYLVDDTDIDYANGKDNYIEEYKKLHHDEIKFGLENLRRVLRGSGK